MRFPRSGFTQVFKNWNQGGPFLRIASAELVHEDEVIRGDSLMGSLARALVARREGLPFDVPDPQDREHFPVDDAHHLLTSVGPNHIRNYSRTKHAGYQGPTEIADLE